MILYISSVLPDKSERGGREQRGRKRRYGLFDMEPKIKKQRRSRKRKMDTWLVVVVLQYYSLLFLLSNLL